MKPKIVLSVMAPIKAPGGYDWVNIGIKEFHKLQPMLKWIVSNLKKVIDIQQLTSDRFYIYLAYYKNKKLTDKAVSKVLKKLHRKRTWYCIRTKKWVSNPFTK